MGFVTYPDPALTARAEPSVVDARLVAVGQQLIAAAAEVKAYGLAGAHIGVVSPVVVLNVAPQAAAPDYRPFYNPRIVAVATETESGIEGSVSLPGVEVAVERPVWVEIAYDDESGTARSARFEGFVARCALHEIEQVEGHFFLERVSRLKREMALKKFAKQRRAG